MQRLNINELINLNYGFVEDGTAAMYLAINPHNNKNGILKQNGCILGIDNEDLREKLASTVLNLCGVNAAVIDLCIDNDQNKYCLSYNVLTENQSHIQLKHNPITNISDKEEIFIKYMQNMFTSIMCLPKITFGEYEKIKKRIIEIHFMDLIIDHYDRKNDNHKIIYDNAAKQYLPPIAYDYGTAFSPNSQQRNGIFFHLTNEEVMEFLIKHYYQDLSNLINNIKQNLTEQNLDLILSQEEYKDLNPNLISNQIKNRLTQLDSLLLGQNLQQQSVQEYDKVI